MSEKPIDSKQDTEFDREGEAVDPRVQIELEKLNAATDDINKLEVDLDESRTAFRQLLYESSMRLDGLSKKLGSCVERARPYYEARIKAKEALHETQLAAVRFERANSAHAAAKEMVYLAEEGLCAEGRTFDHAWQEMLNHATMRVNESELERTLSEADHRRTSYSYQLAETNVQQLQKELKRSIAKSRSYFELKAQFNQILEEQKLRVKRLEKRVGAAKASYAEALHNLEQISDEIHRIRKHETENILVARGTGVGAELPFTLPQSTLSPDTHNTSSATYSSSTNADTDRWTDSTENSASECDEEYLKLPDKLGSSGCPIIPTSAEEGMSQQSEYLSLSSLYDSHVRNRSLHSKNTSSSTTQQNSRPDHIVIVKSGQIEKQNYGSDSPEEENMIQSFFSKIVPAKLRQGSVNVQRNITKSTIKIESVDSEDSCPTQEQKTIPDQSFEFRDGCSNQDITNVETWSEFSLTSNKTTPESERNVCKGEVWTEVNLNDSSSPDSNLDEVPQSRFIEVNETNSMPGKSKLDSSLSNWISRSSIEQSNNSRRQSLDSLILGGLATGERVKEILSQSIMKLNISSLKERRLSEPKVAKPGVRLDPSGGLKKVPSPLEKSMTYLNPEDESASDSESLASVEMLTDEQISSLMLEQNLNDVCQVLGTPVSEMTNLDFFSSTIVQ